MVVVKVVDVLVLVILVLVLLVELNSLRVPSKLELVRLLVVLEFVEKKSTVVVVVVVVGCLLVVTPNADGNPVLFSKCSKFIPRS